MALEQAEVDVTHCCGRGFLSNGVLRLADADGFSYKIIDQHLTVHGTLVLRHL